MATLRKTSSAPATHGNAGQSHGRPWGHPFCAAALGQVCKNIFIFSMAKSLMYHIYHPEDPGMFTVYLATFGSFLWYILANRTYHTWYPCFMLGPGGLFQTRCFTPKKVIDVMAAKLGTQERVFS